MAKKVFELNRSEVALIGGGIQKGVMGVAVVAGYFALYKVNEELESFIWNSCGKVKRASRIKCLVADIAKDFTSSIELKLTYKAIEQGQQLFKKDN